jgi:hypothetical protein
MRPLQKEFCGVCVICRCDKVNCLAILATDFTNDDFEHYLNGVLGNAHFLC